MSEGKGRYRVYSKVQHGIGALLLFSMLLACERRTLTIDKLTVEWMEKPTGISPDIPRFGWVLTASVNGSRQSAYQLRVWSGQQEVWNSGKVASDNSQLVRYAGQALSSGERYTYTVQVWDAHDVPSEIQTSFFETAPASGDLYGSWIGAIRREEAYLPKGRTWHAPSLRKHQEMFDSIPALAKQSIYLRKEFTLEEVPVKATAYISGLGHYELSLNGKKVGESQFAPLWTDYDKSVFYNTYDLTRVMTSGDHAVGVLLGNGMYNVIGDRYRKFLISFGPPTLFFQLKLEYSDGSEEVISSDGSWHYSESPILFNDIFGGEDYDARLEQPGWDTPGFDESAWYPVVIQEAPKGELKAQLAPEVEIQKRYSIEEWYQLDSATYVFDMGQNLSGFPTLRVKGQKGQKVRLTVGERIGEDSTVSQRSTGGPHWYEYTLKGEGVEEWQPRFSYYGYQYIQAEGIRFGANGGIAGLPELIDLKSNFVHSNSRSVGTFECSNEIFTQTHTLINNAIKSNMQAVFTDCPHREKLGWLEEIQLVGPGLLFNYDLTRLFAKQMMDMRDAQRSNGLVPNIAPEYTDFSAFSWGADFTDSPEWGAAVVLVPWQYYEFYGDPSLIQNHYDVMRKYVDYLTTTADGGIVSHGLGDWYDYGEHAAGYSKNSPIALSATSHYYLCAQKLADAAGLLDYPSDEAKYQALSSEIRAAFNRVFFHPETNQYGTGSQYSNAVAIYMGLVEPDRKAAVLQNLIADIEDHGHRLTTGDVGNRYLFQTLAENDLNELMYQMHNHHEAPGYGYQLQYGLTTLTEQWDPAKGNSWNHFMMGQIEEWFFKSLLGIQPDSEHPGFKHFYIQPELVGNMTFAKGSYESIYGQIAVDWKRDKDSFDIKIKVPVNTDATFILPDEVESEQRRIRLLSGVHELVFPLRVFDGLKE